MLSHFSSHLPEIEKIIIDEDVRNETITKKTLGNLAKYDIYRNIEIEYIENKSKTINAPLGDKKKTVYFLKNKGSFLEKCPGSDGVLCCHYFIINTGINCNFDCAYCFLQSYTNLPYISVYANTDKLLDELDNKLKKYKNIHWRIGTGEFTDSLSLDHLTEYSKILVPFFSKIKNATLELKTKSANIDNLLKINEKQNTVVSWSLNPENIIREIEPGTASLEERLNAAQTVAENGYDIAFHLDPLIWHDNWQNNYNKLIFRLLDTAPENKIRWISMGSFRYSKDLKEILKMKNPHEKITLSEMFLAEDGKYRYYAPQRKNMYEFIKNTIHEINPRLFLYLCMETKDMWERVFQKPPVSCKELDQQFEKRRQDLII
ncbi:MAG: radical SAM protein [Spirochaetia bacterium]|nr:radical SAM protein [Spirochaetia bacterium]